MTKAEYQKQWREKHPGYNQRYRITHALQIQTKRKAYSARHAKRINSRNRLYRSRNPDKVKRWYQKSGRLHVHKLKARELLNNACRDGKLCRPAVCSHCWLSRPVEGHHDDYTKPLDIVWVCTQCHTELHR